MTHRIKAEPNEYERIKEIAKTDKTFHAYLRWFHCEEDKPEEYEIKARALLESYRNCVPVTTYTDLGRITGCCKPTIGGILRAEGRCSKEMAEQIISKLRETGVV